MNCFQPGQKTPFYPLHSHHGSKHLSTCISIIMQNKMMRFQLRFKVSSPNLISLGKQFHVRGPQTANACLRKVPCFLFNWNYHVTSLIGFREIYPALWRNRHRNLWVGQRISSWWHLVRFRHYKYTYLCKSMKEKALAGFNFQRITNNNNILRM